MKKILAVFMCAVMLVSLSNVAFADVAVKEKKRLQEIEKENNKLAKERNEAQQEVNKLEEQVAEVSNTLNQTNDQLAKTETKIGKTKKKLKKAQEKEVSQYESMKVRIQYMYENGNTQMIDLLFNSDSITDFMDKAEYITELSQYDRNMLNELVATKEQIANAKTELETQKGKLVTLQKKQKSSIKKLIALSETKQEEVQSFNGQIAANEKHAEDLEAEIRQQEKAAAEAASRAAAEEESREAAKKEAEKKEQQPKEQTTTAEKKSEPVTLPPYHNPRTVGTGSYGWPLPGYTYLSSNYGDTDGRTAPHNGIDIPAPAGTQIVAAAAGTVEWAYYSVSAGNWVGINHGNGIYTVYMHMSAIGVSAGMKVNEGAPIGLVGTTGYSTGNHLHFGVRVNGVWQNPWNYLS
ncbi:MAG: peptidoglycan DD-metalloendopeptidase family protein [Eubacterium sp.]|nr:peptidoglycan DD-metalloendopeptidase family protein [Eubacterium sp.]